MTRAAWIAVLVLAAFPATAQQKLSKSEALKIYAQKTPFKAFAAARRGKAWGMTFGAHSWPEAQQKALALCERNRKNADGRCQIVDTQGNYSTRQGNNYSLSAAANNDYEHNYRPIRRLHKAFSVSSDGPWGWAMGGSETIASRRAVAKCNALGHGLAPCRIIDIDGYSQIR